ncbi:hypothetical protein LMG26846_05966 [Achromobacter insuavis]|uniref:DUF4123 domain-containing protein n=1 Tax=Achromobacter insuavis TaxID=1287735 RepID=UPI0014666B3B|nr:DUF4123 domain-containing protein [Achromobacter insuavis]CAB3924992.1 hypothetical protein LMG26846_05966 [Achromobacter insuavis]
MLEDRDTWIDPATPDVARALHDAAWNHPDAPERYVLLDAAFSPRLPERLARWLDAEDYCSLYAGRYQGEGLDQVAPYLLRLPWVPALRAPLCDKLLQLTRGRPMLSLLTTPASLAQLADHLGRQIEAVDADGKAYLLRLADTRSFAALLDVFAPAQRQRLLAGIERWSYVDRHGALRVVQGDPRFDPAAPTDPYVIAADQQRHLRLLALPDAILRFVQLRAPLFGALNGPPSTAYQLILEGVQRLARRGLDNEALAYRHALALLRRRGMLAPVNPMPSLAASSTELSS